MDYPAALALEAGVCYCFNTWPLDIILKFSKAALLEFFDSPTQILMVSLSRKTVGGAMRSKYLLDWSDFMPGSGAL